MAATSLDMVSGLYRQASTLFITQRFPEALAILEPFLFLESARQAHDAVHEPSTIPTKATVPRKTRVKLWNLYIIVLDSILKLGPERGKDVVGRQRWRDLTSKFRDGEIWDDVVRYGYDGDETAVDPEVVLNLSILLLSHAASQTDNQQRLESYLSVQARRPPDPPEHSTQTIHTSEAVDDEASDPARSIDSPGPRINVKILELYILHVLPRNNEWERARAFIAATISLRQEEQDRLLRTLDALEREKQDSGRSNNGVPSRDSSKSEKSSHDEPNGEARSNNGPSRKYRKKGGADDEAESHLKSSERSTPASNGKTITSRNRQARALTSAEKSSIISRRDNRAVSMVETLRQSFLSFIGFLKANPLHYLRTLLFLIGLLLTLSRGDYRDRVRRVTATGWNKVRATVGMATKVNYI